MILIVMSMLMILNLKAYSVVVLKRRRIVIIFSRPTSFLQKSSCRVSSEKNILNSSVESCGVEKLDKSYILVCLLSIRKYDARMIMYARALYRSFKVRWIGKVYFPTHVLFIINTVIRGAHDNVPTCVIQ